MLQNVQHIANKHTKSFIDIVLITNLYLTDIVLLLVNCKSDIVIDRTFIIRS